MSYKRSIFLINPRFQLKVAAYVCFVIVIFNFFYPLTIHDLLQDFAKFATQYAPKQAEQIKSQSGVLFNWLLGWQILQVALIFLICIFFTHKIAGPVFKIRKFLNAIRDGAPLGKLYFRKGDYFSELADSYNQTFEQLQEDYKKDVVYLAEVTTYIENLKLVVPEDKKIVLDEISTKLKEIQNRFHNIY